MFAETIRWDSNECSCYKNGQVPQMSFENVRAKSEPPRLKTIILILLIDFAKDVTSGL